MRRTLSSVTYRFLLMTVVMCLGLAVCAASAFAGTISGVVYDSSEDPIANVGCIVHRFNGFDWSPWASTYTNSDGTYLVDYLMDSDYRVEFDAYDGIHALEFYDGVGHASQATTITVAGSADVSGIDAHLQLGNAIGGTVTDAPTGVGLQSIQVELYDEAGDYVDTRYTNSDGVYEFQLVFDGAYSVKFSDGWYGLYVEQFWNNKATAELADAIAVAGGETRGGIDATLARQTGTGWGSSISGTVSGAETGWNLPSIEVLLYVWDGVDWAPCPSVNTDPLGRYLFTGLQAGQYTLGFQDSFGNHITEYFSGSPDLAGATSILVGEDAVVTGKDAQLNLFLGAVTGTITDESTHEPLEGVYVELWPEFGGWVIPSAVTDSQGHYTISGLWADNFRMVANGYNVGYLWEYYPSGTDSDKATLLSVDGTALTGIDMQLAVAGVISGQITGSDTGLGIPGASAELYYYSDADDEWYWIGGWGADEDGLYEFGGLSYGTYRIRFADVDGTYLPEYYLNAAGRLDGTDLEVAATPVVADAALERGGSIACSVLDGTSGVPLENAPVQVWAYDSGSDYWYEFYDYTRWTYYQAYTDASGECTITGLPYGTYRVSAYPSGYVQEFYEETATVEAATDISVVNATPITGISFTPSSAGTVAGRVTNSSGTPLSGCMVYLYRLKVWGPGSENWENTYQSDSSDANGDFVIANVAPGTYRVLYSMTGYLLEYYPNNSLVWAASDVVVGTDQDITGIDAQLSNGASISGRVVNASSVGVFAIVRLLRHDPHTNSWTQYTANWNDSSTGNYTFAGVPDGTYRIAVDNASFYTPEYYNNAPDVYSGTDVVLNDVDVVLDDIELAPSLMQYGTIEGTVTADSDGSPVSGVSVYLYRAEHAYSGDGWRQIRYTTTGPDGSYSFDTQTGTYRVRFVDEYGRYLEEYFEDAQGSADAQAFTLSSGESTVCSVALADAASISGTVVDEPTGDPIPDTEVTAYKRGETGWYWSGYSYSDYDGNYLISGLTAGTYRLRFEEQNYYVWRVEYYNDESQFSQAEDIVLSDGEQLTGANAILSRRGAIAGTVTGAEGRTLGGMNVTLYTRTPDAWQFYDTYWTNEDGTYFAGNLAPGTYLVRVSDSGDYGFDRYEAEYYQDATRTAAAQQIQILSQTETLDFVLDPTDTWGSISGSVTDSYTADPIPFIYVQLYQWDDGRGEWAPSGEPVQTDANGVYTIPWVPAGTGYRVGVRPDMWGDLGTWGGIYLPAFHFDSSTIDAALDVTVTVGVETSDVDMDVAPAETTGYITGHVIGDGTGLPAAGVVVTFFEGGSFNYAGGAITAPDGSFNRALTPGQYAVYFDAWPNWGNEFYEDAWDWYDADLVTVDPAASVEITASLEPLGAISGVVTASDTSEAIVDTYLEIFRKTDAGWDWWGNAYSGTDGAYEFVDLPYDTYKVQCYGGVEGDYAPQWYLGATSMDAATEITVGPLSPDTVDFALEPGAIITGRVVDASSSAGIYDAFVEAYRYNDVNHQWESLEYYTWASLDGTYELRGLPAGTYRVHSYDNDHVTQYFNGVRNEEDATPIILSAGQEAPGTDFALEEYGDVKGTITDTRDGTPLQSASVYLYQWDPDAEEWYSWWGSSTNSLGGYQFSNVEPGVYRLYAYKGGFLSEFYDDRYAAEDGQDVVVGDGEIRMVDMALSPGAPITGNVVDESSAGLAGISVTALRWSIDAGQWVWVKTVSTGADGSYTIGGLGDGAYRVEFYDQTQTSATQYFDGSATITDAQDVLVTDGAPTASIDATLTAYVSSGTGGLVGYVGSTVDGAPLESIMVFASRYVAAQRGWMLGAEALTDENGHYEMTLDAGTYRLEFSDASDEYIDEYYNNVYSDLWDADDIIVTGETTTSVDVDLVPGARIQGTVTAAGTGLPVADVGVEVYEIIGGYWHWTTGASTAYDGTYDVRGLPAGEYAVEFYDYNDRYSSEYYEDTREWDMATLIDLAASEVRTGIDAQLEARGAISGTVTDSMTGYPVAYAHVTIWEILPWGTYNWYSITTDDNGHYEFASVPNGTYAVSVDDDQYAGDHGIARYNELFYFQELLLDDATLIEVANSSEIANFHLASTGEWGSIRGKVLDSVTGVPVSDMWVVLYVPNGLGGYTLDPSYSTYTAADGTYLLNYVPLNPDPYQVGAIPDGNLAELYNTTFYSSASTVELGDGVDLSLPAYLANIDINVDPVATVGWIDGLVVSEGTSEPIAGIEVSFYSEAVYSGRTFTAGDGTFSRAVNEGTYQLRFTDPDQNYLDEAYDNTDWSNATSVEATAGETTSITASLTPAARVSGTVRNEFGSPVEVAVVLYDSSGNYVNDISTTAQGTYEFGQLGAGSYSVRFGGWYGYALLWWNQQPTQELSDHIVLSAGQTATSIDATLPMGATVSGKVTSDDGLLEDYVVVTAYRLSGTEWSEMDYAWAEPADDWYYQFNGLLPGEYRFEFSHDLGTYPTIWYGSAATTDLATSVNLAAAGSAVVNQTLDGLPPSVSSDVAGPYTTTASIEITATDGLSGVASISYRLDDGVTQTVSAQSTTLVVTTAGDHTLEYWAADAVGNTSEHVIADFVVYPAIHLHYTAGPGGTISGVALQTVNYNAAGSEVTAVPDTGYRFVKWSDDSTVNPRTDTGVQANVTVSAEFATNTFQLRYTAGPGGTISGTALQTVNYNAAGTEVTALPAARYHFVKWSDGSTANPRTDTGVKADVTVSAEFAIDAEVASTAISGGTRFQTAVAASLQAYPEGLDPAGDKTVLIATGRNWPDALGGSALAGVLDCPILLVDTASVPASVTAEIDRLDAERAIILGGTNAVALTVENALESHLVGADNVTRIAGGSRYETADKIADRVIAEQGAAWDHTAFVATGGNFPDALGAAPLAAANGWPLYLAHPINGLLPATKAKMTGAERVIVLGGESAVSKSVYDGLVIVHTDVVRLAGGSRYETAVKIATYGVEHAGLGWDKVAIATGTNFPDALAGGVLQGKVGSVMVLTRPDELNMYTKAALELHRNEIFSVTYLGGFGAVPQLVRDQVSAALMP